MFNRQTYVITNVNSILASELLYMLQIVYITSYMIGCTRIRVVTYIIVKF